MASNSTDFVVSKVEVVWVFVVHSQCSISILLLRGLAGHGHLLGLLTSLEITLWLGIDRPLVCLNCLHLIISGLDIQRLLTLVLSIWNWSCISLFH